MQRNVALSLIFVSFFLLKLFAVHTFKLNDEFSELLEPVKRLRFNKYNESQNIKDNLKRKNLFKHSEDINLPQNVKMSEKRSCNFMFSFVTQYVNDIPLLNQSFTFAFNQNYHLICFSRPFFFKRRKNFIIEHQLFSYIS